MIIIYKYLIFRSVFRSAFLLFPGMDRLGNLFGSLGQLDKSSQKEKNEENAEEGTVTVWKLKQRPDGW